jgi:hypothetical protein
MRAVFLSVMAFMLTGCGTFSLAPLYSDDVVVRDDRILGRWTIEEKTTGETRFVVTRAENDMYNVMCDGAWPSAASEPVHLAAVIVELDGHRYIDLSLAMDELMQVYMRYGAFVMPTHQIVRMQFDGDALLLDLLTVYERPAEGEREGIDPLTPAQQSVLLGDPEAVQNAVREAVASGDGRTWHRITLVRPGSSDAESKGAGNRSD